MQKWEYKQNIGTPAVPQYGDWVLVPDLELLQLHESDLLMYTKWFELPESIDGGDVYQGLSGTFIITIEAQQWNE